MLNTKTSMLSKSSWYVTVRVGGESKDFLKIDSKQVDGFQVRRIHSSVFINQYQLMQVQVVTLAGGAEVLPAQFTRQVQHLSTDCVGMA